MNCINTGCTIYNGCKIKEVAERYKRIYSMRSKIEFFIPKFPTDRSIFSG